MSHRTFLSAAAAAVLLICGAAHAATRITHLAGPTQQTVTVSDSDQTASQLTFSQCPAYATVAGASVQVNIPSGPNQLVTVRFAGVGGVGGGSSSATGSVRIVGGGRELYPVTNTTMADSFDFPDKTIAVERSGVVAPGTRTVAVQYCISNNYGNTEYFELHDWHLTVEAAPLQ